MPPKSREAALPRRAVLLGGAGIAAGAALVGCAAEPGREPPAPVESVPNSSPPEPPPAPEPIAPMPDVEAVIAAHEGRVPSQWGMEIPGVVRTGYDADSGAPERVFLTLDACGGPAGSGYDERLIAGLIALQVPATLFLNLHWIETNPALAESLAANPLFELGNHGSDHLPLSVNGQSAYGIPGTASVREAAMEVWRNHVALTELTGEQPRWFRPGTAHLDDVGLSIVEALGERVLGFSVNGDAGATFSSGDVAASVGSAVAGDVVIGHMNQPGSGTADGVLAAVGVLRGQGVEFGLL